MNKSSNTLNKIGLSQKEALQIIILKFLQNSPNHAAEIYRYILNSTKHDQLSANRSRTYIYKIVDELHENGLITYIRNGRKKIYHLNDRGKEFLLTYEENLFSTIQKLVIIMKQMRETISGQDPSDDIVEVSDHEKTYISKMINVKVFIQWYVLRRLIFEGAYHGGILYRDLHNWFGWMINHGYFYKVLREMDHQEGWIQGEWLDEDTRSKREYQVTDVGKDEYASIKNQLTKHLDDVEQSLRAIIYLFHPIQT